MLGVKIAARYSFKPCSLGFCGPQNKNTSDILYDYVLGKGNAKKVINVLKKFKSLYPYLKLIAKSNGIKDPFDKKVVQAYWIGNELLEKVKREDLKETIAKEFSKPSLLSKTKAKDIAKSIAKRAKPHHSFHVLFIGSVTGRVKLLGRLLDLCRISWGEITKIKKDLSKIIVRYKPLASNKKIYLGKPRERIITWDVKFLPRLKVGDNISFHWNFVCEKLNQKQIKYLEKYTKQTINLINA